MIGRTSFIALLLVVLVPSHLAAAEVTLHLPDPLVAGVVLRGSVTAVNSPARIARIELPAVPGLEWKTEGGTNYQIQLVNGVQSTREIKSLVLRVQQVPELTIPALTVVFDDGSTATTAAITVTPQAPDAALAGEANATASFEPATIVPGEPAFLVYRLALRQDRLRAIKQPALTPPAGVFVTGERTDSEEKKIDAEGREWSVRMWRWPVTAAQPGTYEARGQQEWYRVRNHFAGLAVESTHQVPIKPATLTVTPLPEAGRPADFAGLIGPLEAIASIDRPRISTGEGAVFTVTLSGPQVGLGQRPTLTLPANVQAYPKDDDEDKAGVRQFRWDLVPGTAGEITLPALTFPYFDPTSRTYRRASTTPLTITVLPGRSRELVVSGITTPNRPLVSPVQEPSALPPPLRGNSGSPTPVVMTWMILAIALVVGALAGLGERLAARSRRATHRGRALAAAIVAKDLDGMARALFALRPDLDDNGRRAADALEHAIDLARFGKGDPGDLARLAAPLVGVA